jgi:hypothetical protein
MLVKLTTECKPFVMSVKFDFETKNEDCYNSLKEQFQEMWKLSLKAVDEQASKMIQIHYPYSFKK